MTHDHTHDNSHAHTDQNQHGEQWHDLPEGFAEHLAVESRLSEPIRQSVLEHLAQDLILTPSVIIDIGSGTGADTIALAQHFPTAQVHAFDVSAELLDRVRSAAALAGYAHRVTTHSGDLNGDWVETVSDGTDVVWASLSIHHLTDPETALRRALHALKPGGVLVLTELTGEAMFWPSDLGTGRAGLAERIAQALPSHHARDTSQWTGMLEGVGYTEIEHREYALQATTTSTDGARYIEQRLTSSRDQLVSVLPDEDLVCIDEANEAVASGMSPVTFTAPRGVWIARRPALIPAG